MTIELKTKSYKKRVIKAITVNKNVLNTINFLQEMLKLY